MPCKNTQETKLLRTQGTCVVMDLRIGGQEKVVEGRLFNVQHFLFLGF
jgi:hypothetical protein